MKEIARRLNLSASTVSRALNGVYGVRASTKALVIETAKAVGYVPNMGAKQLVGKGSGLIGIFAPVFRGGVHSEYLLNFYDMLQLELHKFGKDSLIFAIPYEDYPENRLTECVGSRSLEGCIILSPFGQGHPLIEEALKLGVPFVNFESVIGPHCSAIVSDDREGGRIAGRYLLSQGHRCFAYINGPPKARVSLERWDGFCEALREGGVSQDSVRVLQGDFSWESGVRAAEELRNSGAEVTAIFSSNDRMATGAIMRLAELGLSVPGDISVLGYDGDPYTAYLNPPLTTIRHASDHVSSDVVLRLMELQQGRSGTSERYPPVLLERKSVAVLTKAHSEGDT
ncbi:LacI family transcriptional regulator [Cohnella faecalis]|uniref:LacI family transcriptional regulator n=1 Tax=Cohnella faecalis TaxID=2315694 RepID=A0A398CP87_9BACL|nr:LacI family transcriptional regulator [Cohnella faecalis]